MQFRKVKAYLYIVRSFGKRQIDSMNESCCLNSTSFECHNQDLKRCCNTFTWGHNLLKNQIPLFETSHFVLKMFLSFGVTFHQRYVYDFQGMLFYFIHNFILQVYVSRAEYLFNSVAYSMNES